MVCLDEVEQFAENQKASVASLRWCSPSARNGVRLPSGMVFSLAGIPTLTRIPHTLIVGKPIGHQAPPRRRSSPEFARPHLIKTLEGLVKGYDRAIPH